VVVVPQPVVVVVPPPVRPRLAVFGFIVGAEPGLVPPAVGDWAADTFASYFGGTYELIDRGEVSWHMGRLGITMKDVFADPIARRCLAQSLNARFFVFGAIQQTSSFNVSTHLLDADSGARTGTGTIHVQDHAELKLRMHELAKQLGATPKEQAALAKQGAETEKALNEARKLQKAGNYAKAAAVTAAALKKTPNNVALQAIQQDAVRKAQQAQIEAARRRDANERAAALAAAKKRQKDLAKQADEARARAEREAKSRTEAQRKAQEATKQRAAEQLRAQAKTALARGNAAQAVQSLQSAVALKSDDAAFRELAKARAELEKANRARADAEKKRRDDLQRKEREAAAARVKAEQDRRAKADLERRRAQEKRDQDAHDAYVKQAKGLLAKKQYDQALASAQAAQRLKPSTEAADLVHRAQEGHALLEAEKKGAAARAEAERRLAAEKKKRDADAAAAKLAQDTYSAALKNAQKALAEKNYDQAVTHSQSAVKLFRTDAALTGLKHAEDLRNRDRAARAAEKRRAEDEAKRVARVKALLGEGQKQLAAGQFDKSVAAYAEAKKLAPSDVEVLTGLSRAERERDAWLVRNREAAKRQAEAKRLLDLGKTKLARREYDAAVAALRESVKLSPTPESQAELRKAEKAKAASIKVVRPDPKQKQRKADYELAMSAGKAAVKRNDYQGAVNSFTEALRLMPGDAAATAQRDAAARLLKVAQDAEAKKKAEAKRNADYAQRMAQGDAAMKARRFGDAIAAYQAALTIKPGDAAATQALRAAQDAAKPKKLPPPPPPPPNPAVEHARQMQAGAAFEKQRKYAEAVAAYQAALKQIPNEPKATAALRNAQFLLHWTTGQAHHAARRFADAVKSYEEALKLQPTNATVKDALARAKAGKP
jgi:tetratricopeptide (TPR) repeat protein